MVVFAYEGGGTKTVYTDDSIFAGVSPGYQRVEKIITKDMFQYMKESVSFEVEYPFQSDEDADSFLYNFLLCNNAKTAVVGQKFDTYVVIQVC